ncbi:hypothetical protein MWU52_15265 [Jannaschia sp. S6380]|uniref:hypothetical protein n=1 Tax=Jannaschia sp. S6380 TaxID=2926408 RepID=UPI001FF4FDB9|nr:hypothetical protein [Jannaschia sp. S6380]MCK0168913.1 hypothetical protein [Jannaschia sp. S6380]
MRLFMGSGWVVLSIIFLIVLNGLVPRLVAGYFIAAAIGLQIFGMRLILLVPCGLVGAFVGYLTTFVWGAA